MPIDSLARNSLKVLSGRESIQETIVEGDKVKHRTIPAIEWLTEVLSSTERAESIESVRIDNSEVRGLLLLLHVCDEDANTVVALVALRARLRRGGQEHGHKQDEGG